MSAMKGLVNRLCCLAAGAVQIGYESPLNCDIMARCSYPKPPIFC